MTTSPEDGARVYPRTNPKYWKNISAEDIPTGWMDDMVKRMFDELNRQLIRIENTSTQESDKKDANGLIDDEPDKREKNARVLARIQTTLERLTRMESERIANRATKTIRKPEEARAEIERKVFGVVDEDTAQSRSGEAQ